MFSGENGSDPPPVHECTGLKIKLSRAKVVEGRASTSGGGLNAEEPPLALLPSSASQSEHSINGDKFKPQSSTYSTEDELKPKPKPVKKRGRGRPPGPSLLKSLDLSTVTSSPNARRKRVVDETEGQPPPSKRRVTESGAPQIVEELSVYVRFAAAPPPIGRGYQPRGLKAGPPGPLKGPFTIKRQDSWDEFIAKIVILLQTDRIATSSMQWKYVVPKGSDLLPADNDEGYQRMLVNALGKKTNRDVIVEVEKAEAASTEATMSAGAASSSRHQQGSTTFDGKLDDRVLGIEQSLWSRYAPGKCQLHPDIHCFHHNPTDMHWELTTARITSWANYIDRRMSTEITVPPSTLFTPSTCIKRTRSIKKEPGSDGPDPPPPSSASTALAPPQFDPAMLLQLLVSQQAQQAQQQSALLAVLVQNGRPAASYRESPQRRIEYQVDSSPPPRYQGKLQEWGEENNLDQHTIDGLDKLGFKVGAKLEIAAARHPDKVKEIGFKPMEWDRALEASAKYRKRAKEKRNQIAKQAADDTKPGGNGC